MKRTTLLFMFAGAAVIFLPSMSSFTCPIFKASATSDLELLALRAELAGAFAAAEVSRLTIKSLVENMKNISMSSSLPVQSQVLLQHTIQSKKSQFDAVYVTLSLPFSGSFDAFAENYESQFHRHPPKNLDLWFKYAQKNKCSLSHLYYSRIERELAPFRLNGISREDLIVAQSLPSIWMYSFQNGKVFPADNVPDYYNELFEPIAYLVPNLTMYVNALDEPRIPFFSKSNLSGPFSLPGGDDARSILNGSCEAKFWNKSHDAHGFFTATTSFNVWIPQHRPIPLFSQCTIDKCFMDITIPSHNFIDFSTKADQDWKQWDNKLKMELFWRGSSTGTIATANGNWKKTHRFQLIDKARQHDDWDVKLTQAVQCDPLICVEEERDYISLDGNVPFKEHFDHKFLLDIDGNSFSRSLISYLRSNSLVIRVNTFNVFFDDFIMPGEHYIAADLKDLHQKYSEMKLPDSQAEHIAFEAFRTATRYLRIEDMQCYMARLLLEYDALLQK